MIVDIKSWEEARDLLCKIYLFMDRECSEGGLYAGGNKLSPHRHARAHVQDALYATIEVVGDPVD